MPTIKRKVEMNLPELIEWAWGNGIKNLSFRGHDEEGHLVVASFNDKGEFTSEWCISKDDIFEIEVEEEITEDTEKPKLLTSFKSNPLIIQDDHGKQRAFINKNVPIQRMLNKAKSQRENIDTIHIVDDDDTHTLIWRDGKLVE